MGFSHQDCENVLLTAAHCLVYQLLWWQEQEQDHSLHIRVKHSTGHTGVLYLPIYSYSQNTNAGVHFVLVVLKEGGRSAWMDR